MNEKELTFEEVLNRDGNLVYTNVGFSMKPLIREGKDVLIIEKCDVSTLKKYDVVLFRRKNVKGRGEYVLHRILKILPDHKFWIVGDNCTEGEIVEDRLVLGVLKGLNRGKKAVDFNGIRYRLYLLFWCAPYHLRFFFLKVNNFIKEIIRVLASKLKKIRH